MACQQVGLKNKKTVTSAGAPVAGLIIDIDFEEEEEENDDEEKHISGDEDNHQYFILKADSLVEVLLNNDNN